jgi:DNA polymerase
MGVERVDYSSDQDYHQALMQEEDWYQREAVNESREKQFEQEYYLQHPIPENNMDSNTNPNGILLEELKNNAIFKCGRCELCKTKTNYVCGRGSFNPKILFVGEAPGQEEDEQGKPFVGSAGTILETMLEDIFNSGDYYVTNILKCRPPNNRQPKQEEIDQCKDYLEREIYVLRPDYIVPLGNIATKTIFKMFGLMPESITKIHGNCYIKNQLLQSGSQNKIVPMYHPAVALYHPELRSVMLADMQRLASDINYGELPF